MVAKKLSPLKKFLICFIALILIISVGAYAYIHTTLSKVNNVKLNTNDLGINPQPNSTTSNENISNIAIFGIDSTDGEIGRSDCIMILTIDEQHSKLKLSSIIRDSYVEIPGREGKDKINHAYAFGSVDGTPNGGPTLAIKTLNKNFNLNIKDFMSVNFSSLPKLIDSVGGIDINVTNEELQFIDGVSSPGIQRLNGEQTLAYSRIRHAAGGDFERSHRQRTVLSALYSKFKTISVTSYPSFLSELLPIINTNLTTTNILSLAAKVASFSSNGISQDRFPRDDFGEGKMINGIYYYVFDIPETAKQINDYIFSSN